MDNKTGRINPEDIKAGLVQNLKEEGPHRFGQSFSGAIEACLLFDAYRVNAQSDFDAYQHFQNEVVAKLHHATGAHKG